MQQKDLGVSSPGRMLSIDPGGQYLHILLIDLFLIAARWLLLIQTLYTQCCLKDCLFNHRLCQETLCKFSYLAPTAQLAAPSCRRAEAGLFSFFACIVKHDKKEGLSGCETAVLAILLVTVLPAPCRASPRGWTLFSVYLNSAHKVLSEFFSLGDLNALPTLGLLSMQCLINWLLDALEAALLRKPIGCVGSWHGL